ncbi:MAG: hypothetical protein H0W08_06245 [Acidobacteria bacterium]|nr:hypothetical protein [Acidobacteriota bacterium]
MRWSKVYDVPQHPGNEEIFEALAALGGSEGSTFSRISHNAQDAPPIQERPERSDSE